MGITIRISLSLGTVPQKRNTGCLLETFSSQIGGSLGRITSTTIHVPSEEGPPCQPSESLEDVECFFEGSITSTPAPPSSVIHRPHLTMSFPSKNRPLGSLGGADRTLPGFIGRSRADLLLQLGRSTDPHKSSNQQNRPTKQLTHIPHQTLPGQMISLEHLNHNLRPFCFALHWSKHTRIPGSFPGASAAHHEQFVSPPAR